MPPVRGEHRGTYVRKGDSDAKLPAARFVVIVDGPLPRVYGKYTDAATAATVASRLRGLGFDAHMMVEET
jgi:hypothetical protein